MKSIHIISCLFLLFLLSSCKVIEIRGQYVDDDALSKLEDTRMNKSEVIDLIGTPTIIPEYSPNTWYYIQRLLARRAWFEAKIEEQRIVKIIFDSNDFVDEVVLLNDSHNEEIMVISEYTKTYGTDLNGVQKFIKNIGRFNKTDDKKRKKNKH